MNYFTSVLAARIGGSQAKALARADEIGVKADRKIAKVWDRINRLITAKTMPPDFYWKIQTLLYEILNSAISEVGNGLLKQSEDVNREVTSEIFRTLPVGHRNALLSSASKGLPANFFTEARKKPTEKQIKQMRDMIFPPQTRAEAEAIVMRPVAGVSWQARLTQQTRLASPQQLASLITTWRASGKSPNELQSAMMPYLSGVRTSARRVARTESQRVAMQSRLDAYEQLGDLVIGYQIHATMDSHTRPHHAARNGQVYYKNPKPGQLGLDKMPKPPQEEDGTVAHNCRCWLTPVVDVQPQIENDPDAKKEFYDQKKNVVPDPASYKDWFDSATDLERREAVGSSRMKAAIERLQPGESLTWTHMLDPKTGNLLTRQQLKRESLKARAARLARANALIQKRRLLAEKIAKFGYLRPVYSGVVSRLARLSGLPI